MIENFAWPAFFGIENFFHQSFEQSHITVDAHLQEKIGELRPHTEPRPKLLRMFESRCAGFRQRIDVHDTAAASFCFQQCRQHTRMIRTGILSDYKNRIAEIEIIQRHGAFTKAQRFFHSRAAGFVAHVRAVRQIVGSELSYE